MLADQTGVSHHKSFQNTSQMNRSKNTDNSKENSMILNDIGAYSGNLINSTDLKNQIYETDEAFEEDGKTITKENLLQATGQFVTSPTIRKNLEKKAKNEKKESIENLIQPIELNTLNLSQQNPNNNQALLSQDDKLISKEDESEKLLNAETKHVLKSFTFAYFFMFYSIMQCVPYWYVVNMKELGQKYYSESFMINSLIYFPIFACIGRIFGGFLINRFGLYKINVSSVIICMINCLVLTAYIDVPVVFVVCIYISAILFSMMVTVFLCHCIYTYESELA